MLIYKNQAKSITVKEFKEIVSQIDSSFDDMEMKVLIDDEDTRTDLINSRIGEDVYDKYIEDLDSDCNYKNEEIEKILDNIDECLKFRISKNNSLEYRTYGVIGEIEPKELLLIVGSEPDYYEDD